MVIELTGINVILSICILFTLLIFLILILKSRKINPFKAIGMHFRLGLIVSLAFVLLSFSWTTYDKVVYDSYDVSIENIIPNEIPITDHPKPKPPPPPPIKIEVPDEIIPEDEELEFVDERVEEEDVIEETMVADVDEEIPLPSPPPIVEVDVDPVFLVVEQMPRFPGCESLNGTNKEKSKCANDKLLTYIYKHLRYPQIALENNIQGLVTIQFVVDQKGKIQDAQVVRDIGGGCGAAVLNLVKEMNNRLEAWTPGMQRGRKVKVKYTLPIKFKTLN